MGSASGKSGYRRATTDQIFMGFGQEPDPCYAEMWRTEAKVDGEVDGDGTRPLPSMRALDAARSDFSLVIVRGDRLGMRTPIPMSGLVIGRSPACDVVVGNAGDGTSRKHARLLPTSDGLTVRDLGSTNGLLVNRRRCTASNLRIGDLLQIGLTVFQVADPVVERSHTMVGFDQLADESTGDLSWGRLDGELARKLCDNQSAILCCVALLTIDYYNAFAYTAGPAAARELSARVARLIAGNLRSGDFSCQLGPDRFFAVLLDADIERARDVVEEIRRAVSDVRFTHDGEERRHGLSIVFAEAEVADLDLDARVVIDNLQRVVPMVLFRGGNQVFQTDLDAPHEAAGAPFLPSQDEPSPGDSALDRLLKASAQSRSLFANTAEDDLELPTEPFDMLADAPDSGTSLDNPLELL